MKKEKIKLYLKQILKILGGIALIIFMPVNRGPGELINWWVEMSKNAYYGLGIIFLGGWLVYSALERIEMNIEIKTKEDKKGVTSRVKTLVIIGSILIILLTVWIFVLGMSIFGYLINNGSEGSILVSGLGGVLIGCFIGAFIVRWILKRSGVISSESIWVKETRKVRIAKYVLIAVVLLALPIFFLIISLL